MKKYFETPAVNMALFDNTDLIMASAEQLAKKNGNLAAVKDEAAAANDLWKGTGDGWL